MAVLSFIVRTKAALAVFCRALGLSILFGLLASLTSLAVLPPFEHEVNRIHARLVFLGRVMETKQVSRGDYYALNKAKVKLLKVFRGIVPGKPLAIIKYRSRLPGRAQPDGGQRLYKLKHNAIVLAFAHSWQGKNEVVYMLSEPPRSTASSLRLPRTANTVKGFCGCCKDIKEIKI